MSAPLGLNLFFISIRLVDLLEIGILAFVLYSLYRLMRGTIAMQILVGLLGLLALESIVSGLNMRVLRSLFSTVSEVFVIAIIILFQPEIRRVLLVIAQNPLVRRFVGGSTSPYEALIDALVPAVMEMSAAKTGALIVIARNAGLRTYVETGTPLQATVTHDLLVQIFHPKTPLHDGAVIIEDGQIAAARCILPVSQSRRLDGQFGLRHRAALGMSEETDAVIVVVSEERGSIAFVENGQLTPNVDEETLRKRLLTALTEPATRTEQLAALADA
ncbi:MAG: diadenylate cyclase CdaA [Bacteroidota bacterium]